MTDTADRIVTVARSSTDTWVFIVNRNRACIRDLIFTLARYATNPELSLTWTQADRIWRGVQKEQPDLFPEPTA